MAVQAQYPSNVLLLNRNGEEGIEYPLQPQPGGGGGGGGGIFPDQSQMFLHNGGHGFPRKRSREAVEGGLLTATTTTSTATLAIPHQNQSQLIDISQLHHPPNNISTGLRLSSSDQHFHLHHHHQQHNNAISRSFLTEEFASRMNSHRDELNHFLLAQEEGLRRTLAEKTQRHYRALIGAAHESINRRLKEKDTELQKSNRRHAELESRAAQLAVEVQVWQARARAHEAAAASLQAQLQQAIIEASAARVKSDDGGGVGGESHAAEDAESAYVDPDRVTAVTFCCGGGSGDRLICKSCGRRAARVVVIPCRHLCLCSECDNVVQSCPVCLHVRNSSVEVLLC